MVFAIEQHESATGVHMSVPSWTPLPLPPSHPSRWSQSTDFGFPASHRKLPLATYFTYGDVHVSVLFSHVVPHSPSPTVSKMCFLCCPARGITSTLFLDSIYMHYYTLCAMTASNACILGLNGSMERPCSRLCSCLLLPVLPFALCASQVYVLLRNYSKVNYRLYKPHV